MFSISLSMSMSSPLPWPLPWPLPLPLPVKVVRSDLLALMELNLDSSMAVSTCFLSDVALGGKCNFRFQLADDGYRFWCM